MIKSSLLGKCTAALFSLAAAATASAATINVHNDSTNALLGTIETYDTTLSVADFYQYGSPDGASYNGQLNGGPGGIDGTTQLFFVNSTVDGLAMVMLHDVTNDTSGGDVETTWTLTGDTAALLFGDDNPGNDFYTTTPNSFNAHHLWGSCCTDGSAIGTLGGGWTMRGGFDTITSGISSWQATSSDGANVALPSLTAFQDVRFSVPAPAPLLLLATGLIGFGVRRRRNQTPSI